MLQVLGFAGRLADARREVADCQRALIRLQQATVAAAAAPPATNRSYHKTDNDDRTPRRRQRLQVPDSRRIHSRVRRWILHCVQKNTDLCFRYNSGVSWSILIGGLLFVQTEMYILQFTYLIP